MEIAITFDYERKRGIYDTFFWKYSYKESAQQQRAVCLFSPFYAFSGKTLWFYGIPGIHKTFGILLFGFALCSMVMQNKTTWKNKLRGCQEKKVASGIVRVYNNVTLHFEIEILR